MITRVKKITPDNGMILKNMYTDTVSDKAITFFAPLPKNAVVDRVKVDGKFLEDYEALKTVTYHRELKDNDAGMRAVATVYFFEGIPKDLSVKIDTYQIQDFEVYYHEEAITEVE